MTGGVGRLTRRAEFLRVAAARRKWVATGLILQAAAAESGMDAMPRIGFTVTKRVGNAVTRNRARRRLRAAAQQVMPHAAGGHDYVLIGRDATVARPFPLMLGDLETALRRLKLWRPTEDDA
jgi:ribonuclease P protein component